MNDWLAVRTRSRFEKVVAQQLDIRGIEYALPLVRTKRDWGGRKAIVELPLISGYCFVRPERPVAVLELTGVAGYITFQSSPALIPNEEIEALMNATAERYKAKEYYGFRLRQAVRITDTCFRDMIGTVDQIQGDRVRVIIPTTIGRQVSVELDARDLEPLLSSHQPLMTQVPVEVS